MLIQRATHTEHLFGSIVQSNTKRVTSVDIRFSGAKVGDEDCYTKELGCQVRYITSVLAVPIQARGQSFLHCFE